MRTRPEPGAQAGARLESRSEMPDALPVLSLPRDGVTWLAARAPSLAVALLLATLGVLLALATTVQVPRFVALRGVVDDQDEELPRGEHAVTVDMGGANLLELLPERMAMVTGDRGAALRGRIAHVAELPEGCGGARPCRRVRIRLEGERPLRVTSGEVEVRVAIASRSLLTWLIESVRPSASVAPPLGGDAT